MPQAFEPEDLLLHQRITGIDACPDREAVISSVRHIDTAGDTNRSALWLHPLDGTPPRPLTAGTSTDQQPRCSPDGSQVAFLSDRLDGSPQIFLMPLDGGEARPLGSPADFPQGVVDIAWRPDGLQLAVLAVVQVDPDWHGAPADGRAAPPPGGVEVAWRLPFKQDGLGYTLNQQVHLYTVDVPDGTCRQITQGPFEVKAMAWSPDGSHIACTRTREGRTAHQTDVWTMAADGSDAMRRTRSQPTAQSPQWSPDGRWIAFSGNVAEGDAQARVWLLDAASAPVAQADDDAKGNDKRDNPDDPAQVLGDEAIEVYGDSLRWAPDSQSLLLVTAREGRRVLARLDLQGRMQECVGGDRQIGYLACTRDHWVYTAESTSNPGLLLACRNEQAQQGSDERRLDGLNAWWHDRMPLQMQARRFRVPSGKRRGPEGSADDRAQEGSRAPAQAAQANAGNQEEDLEEVQGWLMRAADAPPGPQPLLVDIHGGPASYAFLGYHFHAYWPVLCSRGWTVLALNAVGSSSFGRDFTGRLRGRWGELDLPQHLAAVRALQREGLADERIAIAGKSYGGYLSAWAIGQTAQFRAAVVCAPVTNLETHYGTSDSGYYADPYSMHGEPYIDRDTSQRLSPMKHVARATTPTLILQGKEDERCPKCQSEELFTTLARGSRSPVEMVLYPGGDHHFFEQGTPLHRVDMVQRLVDWLQRWIDQVPAPLAPERQP